jgi:hypothetical protein
VAARNFSVGEAGSAMIYTASRDRLIKVWDCNYASKKVRDAELTRLGVSGSES